MATNNEFKRFISEYNFALSDGEVAIAEEAYNAAKAECEKEIAELQAQVKQLNEQMEADDKLINIYQRDINKQDNALILRDLEIVKLREFVQLYMDNGICEQLYYKAQELLSTSSTPTHLQEWYESMVGEAVVAVDGNVQKYYKGIADLEIGQSLHAIKEFKA